MKRVKPQSILRGLAKMLDRVQEANELAEEDPLGFVDAVLGQARERKAKHGTWWELFGMDAKPKTKGELECAWKQWAARNHPDKGGSEPAFRYMRSLYDQHLERL